MRGFAKTLQAGETLRALLRAGGDILEREGLSGLTVRAVAKAASVSPGGVQFHFRTTAELAEEVVKDWTGCITRDLVDSAKAKQGLDRASYLCLWWISYPEVFMVAVEGARKMPPGAYDRARAVLLAALRDWTELTRRALRQARIRGELKTGVNLEALALELHRIVWSPWSLGFYNQQGSPRLLLEAAWDRLAAVAIEPPRSLPSRRGFVSRAPSVTTAPLVEPPPPGSDPTRVPDWRVMFDPTDPLFHAFERHELMGDPRLLSSTPPILEDDRAAAETYVRRTQASQPGATG